MAILAMMLAQAALFGVEPIADPMAGVTPDWSLCTHPDDDAKTCLLMATFTKAGEGRYTELDRMSIIGIPGLILEYSSSTYVKDGNLCSVARRSDLDGARIIRHVEGTARRFEAATLQQIRFMYPIEGKEVCSRFYPDGVHLELKVWVNGKSMDEMATPARWVGKDDGYQVTGWHGAITTPPGGR